MLYRLTAERPILLHCCTFPAQITSRGMCDACTMRTGTLCNEHSAIVVVLDLVLSFFLSVRSLRLYAKQMGFKLNDKGLYPVNDRGEVTGPSVPCRTERQIFEALGLRYKEPWERHVFDASKGGQCDEKKLYERESKEAVQTAEKKRDR